MPGAQGDRFDLNRTYLRWTPQRRARSVPGAQGEREDKTGESREQKKEGGEKVSNRVSIQNKYLNHRRVGKTHLFYGILLAIHMNRNPE